MLGNPSEKDFKGMVSINIIPNCPITHSNVTNAQKIFGQTRQAFVGRLFVKLQCLSWGITWLFPRRLWRPTQQ
jgi:hypothetical protein